MAGLHDSVVPELRRGPATSPMWVAFGMGSIWVLLLGFGGFPSRNHLTRSEGGAASHYVSKRTTMKSVAELQSKMGGKQGDRIE